MWGCYFFWIGVVTAISISSGLIIHGIEGEACFYKSEEYHYFQTILKQYFPEFLPVLLEYWSSTIQPFFAWPSRVPMIKIIIKKKKKRLINDLGH